MFKNSISAVLICLALSGASVAAVAQQPTAAKRATAKAKPKFFNPFDTQRSRLKINRYGFFTYVPAGALSESPAATAVPSSLTASQVTTPPILAASTTSGSGTATASQLVVATAPVQLSAAAGLSLSGGTAIGIASASGAMESFAAAQVTSPASALSTRPPFRPPVRSPFRPPPRPPF